MILNRIFGCDIMTVKGNTKIMPEEKTKTEEFIAELAPKNTPINVRTKNEEVPNLRKKIVNIMLRHWKKIVLLVAALIFLAMVGTTVFFYREWKEFKSGRNVAAQDEVSAITNKIGKFMELPSDEVPTVATVSDREKLKGQPFFARAQNGDKVLIYTKAQKAILYRPSENKVIEAINLSAQNLNNPSSENPVSQ
jgi:hypothetical protein